MKIRAILIPVAVLFLEISVTAQMFPNHLDDDKLKGKIKQVSTIYNDQTRDLSIYNTNGYQTEHWFFKPVELLQQRYIGVYNSTNQIIEETMLDKGIDPRSRIVYAYDPKGIPIGSSRYGANNSLYAKYIYQYDESGRMKDSIHLDAYGNILEQYSCWYDTRGRRIKRSWFSRDDSSTMITEYQYNEPGQLISEKCYETKPGIFDYEASYSYDPSGKLIAEKRKYRDNKNGYDRRYGYDSNGFTNSYISFDTTGRIKEKKIYIRDEKGNILSDKWYNSNDEIYVRYEYMFDSLGNQVELNRYDAKDKLQLKVRWVYEYDKNINWVKSIQFVNDVPGEQIRREIEYY